MTYCVGWRYRNSVYLVGDTVLTDTPISVPISTFGQVHSVIPGAEVAEAALKITEIAPGLAVAIAGDVESAINIVDFIRDNHAEFATPRDLFQSIETNMALKEYVEILFARAPLGRPTSLTKWNTKTGIEQTRSDYYEIGQLPILLKGLTLEVLKELVEQRKMDEAALLPMMTAVLQSYGIHDDLIQHNVGGIIFGLRANAGSTAWQHDTAYLLYDFDFSNLTFVFAMMRGDVLTAYSTLFQGARFLMFPSNRRTPEQVWRNVPAQIDVSRWHHCTCLRVSDRRVTSIYRPSLDIPSRYINFSTPPDSGGRVKILSTPQLRADLCRPLTRPKSNGEITLGACF